MEEQRQDLPEAPRVRLNGWRRPRKPNDADRTAENRARGWGGRRPGAGAPKGNLNALKHGCYSHYQRALIDALLQVPDVREAMINISKRQRAQTRRAEQGAAALMEELVRRVGRLAIHPEDDHLEDIQEFLDAIRSAGTELQRFSKSNHGGRPTIEPQSRQGSDPMTAQGPGAAPDARPRRSRRRSPVFSDEFEQHGRLLEHDEYQERPGQPAEETKKPLHAPMYHSTYSFLPRTDRAVHPSSKRRPTP